MEASVIFSLEEGIYHALTIPETGGLVEREGAGSPGSGRDPALKKQLRRAALAVRVFVFLVLSLATLFLARLSRLTRLLLLTLLSGLFTLLARLSALLTALLPILFHIVCH